jgi:hypothetical protein
MDQPERDVGRSKVTNNPQDTGASDASIARVANRALLSRRQRRYVGRAVDLMLAGGKPNEYLDKKNIEKRTLTGEQRQDSAFLGRCRWITS